VKSIRLAIDAAPQRMRRIVERMVANEGDTRASA
jgi:vanillate O-demethylase monooxygenase subunit